MEFKLGGVNEKEQFELIFWFQNLAISLEQKGVDTVFKIPSVTWIDKIYLTKDWGKWRSKLVDPRVKQLEQGVYNVLTGVQHNPCPYNI